jgi:hypothetical protein
MRATVTILGYPVDEMLIALVVGLGLFVFVLWKAQRDNENKFNVFDLVMEDGHASKTGVAFMLVLLVSTWVIVDKQVKGALDAATFGAYLLAWAGPLIARVVFNKKDPPSIETPGEH